MISREETVARENIDHFTKLMISNTKRDCRNDQLAYRLNPRHALTVNQEIIGDSLFIELVHHLEKNRELEKENDRTIKSYDGDNKLTRGHLYPDSEHQSTHFVI